jgi:hypothetical protein
MSESDKLSFIRHLGHDMAYRAVTRLFPGTLVATEQYDGFKNVAFGSEHLRSVTTIRVLE